MAGYSVTYQQRYGSDGSKGSGGLTSKTLTGENGEDCFSINELIFIDGFTQGFFKGTTVVDDVTFVYIFFDSSSTFRFYGNIGSKNPSEIASAFPSDIRDLDIDIEKFPVCFAAGTPIATTAGERSVEKLLPGDKILTAVGREVDVKWIGRQRVAKIATSERSLPVCVKTGALSESTPHSDLTVTADHGLLVGGMMVNAGALVNGATIVRVPRRKLTDATYYYHVETEYHDVILAAGAPAETFVDNGTRRGFDNYDEYVALFGEPDPADTVTEEITLPRVMSRRQLPKHIRQLLADRENALGMAAVTVA